MSKSPAFQWYAADYLADERVAQLTLEAEAVYVRLLSYCWREGSIPANATLCAPMCKYADVKVVKAALALFIKSPGQPGRLIHKRLEEERAKQVAFRERQAQHGKKGGRPKKDENPDPSADEKPEKPNPLPSLSQPLAEPKPACPPSSSSSSKLTDVSKDAGEPAPEPPAKPKPIERRLPLPADDTPLFNADNWPSLTDPQKFAGVCAKLGYPQVDFELYRHQIAASLEGKELPASSLRKWIESYLNNDSAEGKLKIARVQVPNEIPSNYTGTAPYVAPVGGRIPDMSSILNPNWKPPQA